MNLFYFKKFESKKDDNLNYKLIKKNSSKLNCILEINELRCYNKKSELVISIYLSGLKISNERNDLIVLEECNKNPSNKFIFLSSQTKLENFLEFTKNLKIKLSKMNQILFKQQRILNSPIKVSNLKKEKEESNLTTERNRSIYESFAELALKVDPKEKRTSTSFIGEKTFFFFLFLLLNILLFNSQTHYPLFPLIERGIGDYNKLFQETYSQMIELNDNTPLLNQIQIYVNLIHLSEDFVNSARQIFIKKKKKKKFK